MVLGVPGTPFGAPLVVLGRPLGLLVLPEGLPGGSRGALWRSGEGPWGALIGG